MYFELKSKDDYLKYVIENYSNMIYKLALARTGNKQDSEDIFQEVFLKLSKNLPDFKNKEHEKAWLIRVTINCTKNLFKYNKIRQALPLDENLVLEQEEKEVLHEVFNLPQKYRTVIHLYYYEKYSIKEISQMLNQNENTVKTHLSRARSILKEKIEGGFDNE